MRSRSSRRTFSPDYLLLVAGAEKVMTARNEPQLREVVLRVLYGIAPEVDLGAIDPGTDLREQLDIDSMDLLNFVIALHKELGVEIPDSDVVKFTTLNGSVKYLLSKASKT
jgi:acyl carrier protein